MLVERPADRPGWVRGTDRRFCPVEVPGDFAADEGRLVRARVTAATPDGMVAHRGDAA